MIKYLVICIVCAGILFTVLFSASAPALSKVVFTESAEAFVNPYKGYAPWAVNQTPESKPEPDFSLAFALIKWKDFEPQKGVYDFKSFEERNNFEHLKKNNVKFILRFVCDYPGREEHMDIPQWLYDEMGGAGAFYENSGQYGFAPDYSNEVLIERHRIAVSELGKRYGSSPDVAYVQLGSLGQWGEWHNWVSKEPPFPDTDVSDKYVNHYFTAFKNTILQMRRPYEIMRGKNVGFYNDMMGVSASTYEWLDWIAGSDMADFYNTVPSGGEFASTYSLEEYFGGMYGEVKQMITDSNTTFIGGMPPDGDKYKANADDLLKTMGYRFVAKKAEYSDEIRSGEPMRILFDIENIGIAPFYFNWNFHILIYDENGAAVKALNPGWGVRDVLPGKTVTYQTDAPLELPKGEYTVKIGLYNPESKNERVRLANQEVGDDMFLTVGKIVLK